MDSQQFLSQEFIKVHSVDAARILEQLPVHETGRFLTSLSPDIASKVIDFTNPLLASKYLEIMDTQKSAAIIENLSLEVAATLLRRLEDLKRSDILKLLPDDIKNPIGLLLKYRENTAGALMDPQVFTLSDDSTVKEALKLIKKYPKHVFYHIPVINREHVFLGLTNIRELMLSKPELLIESLMHTGVETLSPNASCESILTHPNWRFYYELSVTDENDIFLGIISYQIVRSLEGEIHKSKRESSLLDAGKALGELYWIGMSAFLKGTASIFTPNKK